MAKLAFNIEWITRPCVFYSGGCDFHNGFWHMWHIPSSGVHAGKVIGIVEDEDGFPLQVERKDIFFLDSGEKFSEYDWEFMKKAHNERFERRNGDA